MNQTLFDERRPSYEQLVERCAKDGLFIGPKGVERVSPAKVREKYSISQEAWDAIPNKEKANVG